LAIRLLFPFIPNLIQDSPGSTDHRRRDGVCHGAPGCNRERLVYCC